VCASWPCPGFGRDHTLVEHSIYFGEGPEDVLIETAGRASMPGLDAVVTSLLGHERYMPAMALLFDHTELDWRELHAEDIVRRVHMPLKAADLIGPRRIAVVASDPRIADAQPLRHDEPSWKAFTSVEDGRVWLDEI
jgi:hypothetical protein